MSRNPGREEIKERLEKYGVLIAYSALGMAITGFFSFKLARTRLDNMRNIKTKSRVPLMHGNMKRVTLGGALAAVLYGYGLWEVIKRVPQSETNLEMADETFLAESKKKDPELQDLYILRSMRLFGVSEELVSRAKEEFRRMGPERQSEEKSPNFNWELFWNLLRRRRVEKQYEDGGK